MQTRISDVFVPEIYQDYQQQNSLESTSLFSSGIITPVAALVALAAGAGTLIDMPFWNDLDADDEANVGNDDIADKAVPAKIDSGRQIGKKLLLNKSWSAMDLVNELAGSSPMQAIARRTSTYWERQSQRRLAAIATAIMAGNVANNDGDMVHDVASESIAGASASTVFTREGFTSAVFSQGDNFEATTSIAVHSVVMKRMVDNDDVELIRDSAGQIVMSTYMGRRIVVNDQLPVIAGLTDGFKYVSVLFGTGAIGYGMSAPAVPVEVDRDPSAGNGAGVETLHERTNWVMHPLGYKWTESAVAGVSPTIAEMSQAANWERVVERKAVPMAFMVTNG